MGLETSVVVPARSRSQYTAKTHNPRKIWEETQARNKEMTREEFEKTTREQVGKRMDKIEADIQTLVKFVGNKADEQGHILAAIDELKDAISKLSPAKGVNKPPKEEPAK